MQRARRVALGLVAGAVVAVTATSDVFAAGGRDHGFGYRRHHWVAAFLMFLVVAAAVALLAIVLWRGRSPAVAAAAPAPPPSPTLNAQTILADRLARGEISPEDYRAAIAVLREGSP